MAATRVQHAQSDIELRWRARPGAGIDPLHLETLARELLVDLRARIEERINCDEAFLTSLDPLPLSQAPAASQSEPRTKGESTILDSMLFASTLAGTGPMAAVAGAIASSMGKSLLGRFPLAELVVENGGDLWFHTDSPLRVRVDAALSSLSGKIALVLPPGSGGCACSSAKAGPSLSLGRADAAVVVHKDAACADALATALCNRIKHDEDLEEAVNYFYGKDFRDSGTRGVLAVKGARLACVGEIRIEPLAPRAPFDAE